MSDLTDKIGKLLMQAEQTDNQEEKDAFFTKAQTLATAYSIDLEIARTRQADKTKRETPTHRRIYLSEYTKARQGLHRYVNLFLRVAEVQDVTCNIAHNSTYVIAFGFPSDIDVTERLFASLVVQMVMEADAAVRRGDHKAEKYYSPVKYNWWGERISGGEYRSDARVFKASFYEAFTSRVTARLREAKREQAKVEIVVTDAESGETTSTTGALVLRSKVDDVQDYYKQTSTAKGSWRGGSSSSVAYSSAGASAGSAAGSRARLSAPSAIGNRTAVSA